MNQTCKFTAIIVREGDIYLARCSELDITSQGPTVETARANLADAVAAFLETVDPAEVTKRMRSARESQTH